MQDKASSLAQREAAVGAPAARGPMPGLPEGGLCGALKLHGAVKFDVNRGRRVQMM